MLMKCEKDAIVICKNIIFACRRVQLLHDGRLPLGAGVLLRRRGKTIPLQRWLGQRKHCGVWQNGVHPYVSWWIISIYVCSLSGKHGLVQIKCTTKLLVMVANPKRQPSGPHIAINSGTWRWWSHSTVMHDTVEIFLGHKKPMHILNSNNISLSINVKSWTTRGTDQWPLSN